MTVLKRDFTIISSSVIFFIIKLPLNQPVLKNLLIFGIDSWLSNRILLCPLLPWK